MCEFYEILRYLVYRQQSFASVVSSESPSLSQHIIERQFVEGGGDVSIKVLIADDSEVVRKSIVNFLKDKSNIEIIGQASSFAEVLELTTALKPDVLLMDVHMTDKAKDGKASVAAHLLPSTKSIVAMSVYNDIETKELAMSLGVSLLLDKCNLVEELVPTILKVRSSERFGR
jgi:DNA-binding NarL/FixJ family response regulator